jgi:hypothetical protein
MTAATFRALAEISRDIAQIFFAAVLVSPLLGGEVHPLLTAAGLLLSLLFWYLSILFVNELL